jgi:hypothetical protein
MVEVVAQSFRNTLLCWKTEERKVSGKLTVRGWVVEVEVIEQHFALSARQKSSGLFKLFNSSRPTFLFSGIHSKQGIPRVAYQHGYKIQSGIPGRSARAEARRAFDNASSLSCMLGRRRTSREDIQAARTPRMETLRQRHRPRDRSSSQSGPPGSLGEIVRYKVR